MYFLFLRTSALTILTSLLISFKLQSEEIQLPLTGELASLDSESSSFFSDHRIRAVVLVSSNKDLLDSEDLEEIQGLKAVGVDIPGGVSSLNAKLRPLYLDQKFDEETVSKIKQAIYQYYENNFTPFITVSVPSQNISKGVLQIIVQESRIGKIEVVGNQWAPKKTVRNYLGVKEGEPIPQRTLLSDIDFMNRNPFRRVSLIYSRGDEKNTTDLTFDVEARRPYRFYVGVDNTGIPTTGRERIFAGFSWDQMFQLDQILFFQYTTNYNPNKFYALTGQYTAFLPWKGVLNLYGGYSSVHANVGYPSRTNHGKSGQASLRYHAPLPPTRLFTHEIIAGFDWKSTNNTVQYIDTVFPTFAGIVNISQGVFGYTCKYQQEEVTIESDIEMFFSPGQILSHQSNEDFEMLRPGAKNSWIYFNGSLRYEQKISYFTYNMFFRGQASSQTLLPNEQLGIGGYSSVRGYDERQLSVDSGCFISNELRLPSTSVFRRKQPNQDKLQFHLFVDFGGGTDYSKIYKLNPRDYLVGAGPGFRYYFGSYFTARLDWGIKLHHQAEFTGGNSMLHFSVIGSY